MEIQPKSQLDLLKDRIEYDEIIFGTPIVYFGFVDSEDNNLYTSTKNPQVGDMAYQYIEEEMVEFKPIESISESSETIDEQTYTTTDSITIDDITYDTTDVELNVYETYIKVLKRLLEDSKYIGLSLRFPYKDYSEMELPTKYKNWQLRCSVEIYQSIGTEGVKSYAENGLSWTRDSGYISYELRQEIEPMVGYIEEEEEVEQNGEI